MTNVYNDTPLKKLAYWTSYWRLKLWNITPVPRERLFSKWDGYTIFQLFISPLLTLIHYQRNCVWEIGSKVMLWLYRCSEGSYTDTLTYSRLQACWWPQHDNQSFFLVKFNQDAFPLYVWTTLVTPSRFECAWLAWLKGKIWMPRRGYIYLSILGV